VECLQLLVLCLWQSQPTAHCSCPGHTDSRAAFHPRARAPPCIGGGLQVLVHFGRQVIQVVGSRPLEVHGSQGLCRCPHFILGSKVWCAIHPHFRLRPPVHLFTVGGPHQAAGDQARADHRLSPTVQQHGGENSWAAEGCLEGAVSWLKMARALAMGATGPANRPERRQRRLGG
jgi:hypothetical protein